MNPELSLAWDKVKLMLKHFITLLPNIAIAIVIFSVFLLASWGIKLLIEGAMRNYERSRNLRVVLGRLAQGAVILVGLFVAISIVIPSLKADDLVQLFGVSGVAIGFAFREILQNFLAGLLILLTQPFQIDDQIIYQDYEGTVKNIQTRATTLRTYDGRLIVIPNSELFTNSVLVNTAFEKRRLEYDIGIGYGEPINRAKALILEAIRSTPGVIEEPAPDVLVIDLAESTLNLRMRWWVDPPRQIDVLEVKDQVLTAVFNKLTANGVDMPYPTQQILLSDPPQVELPHQEPHNDSIEHQQATKH